MCVVSTFWQEMKCDNEHIHASIHIRAFVYVKFHLHVSCVHVSLRMYDKVNFELLWSLRKVRSIVPVH